jgi:hypothetical protein
LDNGARELGVGQCQKLALKVVTAYSSEQDILDVFVLEQIIDTKIFASLVSKI